MNILTDSLPRFVDVNNRSYAVHTDFRIWIEFDRTMHLKDISTKDKIMLIFNLCFNKTHKILPEDVDGAMDALCSFYLCEKDIKKKGNSTRKSERAIDFSEDSGYIYSAFLTQYGIDLLSVPYLHWYVFCALLEGLEDDRSIKKIIKYRICRPESARSKEKKEYLAKMKEIYALTDTRTNEEKEEELADILSQIL